MKSLARFQTYSREEVHGIFAPDTTFTPQAGTWGLHGFVSIPDRPNDYVFFVTFGQSQGEHQFDEGITDDGVLTWQSQPRQGLSDIKVMSWINHDELVNNIYLFVRPSKGTEYAYLGRLKYLTHDEDREKPVYFQWQILGWDNVDDAFKNIGIPTTQESVSSGLVESATVIAKGLVKDTPPQPRKNKGKTTREFRAVKGSDFSGKEKMDKALGLAGELLVLKLEIERLREEGLDQLADKVIHTSVVEGDGAGYDIRSYNSDGTIKYVEVKTTKGGKGTAFYISPNELAFSKVHQSSFELVRVFGFDKENHAGSYYVLNGDMNKTLKLEPTQYRAFIG